jgi:hypothetical protein
MDVDDKFANVALAAVNNLDEIPLDFTSTD